MAVKQRLTPTLFDKLVADTKMSGLRRSEAKIAEAETADISSEIFKYYSVPQLERFNEAALRMTIRREIAWLLNTVNLRCRRRAGCLSAGADIGDQLRRARSRRADP